MSKILQYQHRGPTTAREYHDPSETEVIEFLKTDAEGGETDSVSGFFLTRSRSFLKDSDFELRVYRRVVQRNDVKYFLDNGEQVLDKLSILQGLTNMHVYSLTLMRSTFTNEKEIQDLEGCIAQARAIADEAGGLRTVIETKLSEEHERRKILRPV